MAVYWNLPGIKLLWLESARNQVSGKWVISCPRQAPSRSSTTAIDLTPTALPAIVMSHRAHNAPV